MNHSFFQNTSFPHKKIFRSGFLVHLIFSLSILVCSPSSSLAQHPTILSSRLCYLRVNQTATQTQLLIQASQPLQGLDVQDLPSRPMSVAFTGVINTPFNKSFDWQNFKGLFMENRNGRVQIFIKRSVLHSVQVESQANRITIRIPHTVLPQPPKPSRNQASPARPQTAKQTLASGVQYWTFTKQGPAGQARVKVLEVDPSNPQVEILPALASASGNMGKKQSVAAMVIENQALAGVNGSFFKQDKGIPLGILIINQELITGALYNRVALGIGPDNQLSITRVQLAGEVTLPDHTLLRLNTVNQPRVQTDQVVAYTERWGSWAPKVPVAGLQIALLNNRVVAVSQTAPLAIPKGGLVLSGPATMAMSRLAQIGPLMPISLRMFTLPDWSGMKHAIGGGPWLVKDGAPYIDWQVQHFTRKSLGVREPRTAIGITREGKLLLVTIDGRQKNQSIGMTLYELSHLMMQLGAVQAMNLDGGSSTQMAIGGKTVNTPSSGVLGVSNALIVKLGDGNAVALQNAHPPLGDE